MADGPQTKAFGVVEVSSLVILALLILQARIDFERDKDGRWSFKYSKDPTSEKLLTKLAEMVSRFNLKN